MVAEILGYEFTASPSRRKLAAALPAIGLSSFSRVPSPDVKVWSDNACFERGMLPKKDSLVSTRPSDQGTSASSGTTNQGSSILDEEGEQGRGTQVRAFDYEEEEEEEGDLRGDQRDNASPSAVAPPVFTSPSLRRGGALSVASWEAEMRQMLSSNRAEAVLRPASSSGLVRCYVVREKAGLFGASHATFRMHLENDDVFLLAARRRKKSKTSSYVISLDANDLKRDTENCLAKLKANFIGTEYMLWGKDEDAGLKKGFAEQLCINFQQTALTANGGHRTLFCSLPVPESGWRPSSSGTDSLGACLDQARRRELPPYLERRLAMLSNKQPEWDPRAKAFTLDFNRRVKEASVKNFQLVAWEHNTDQKGADLLLQFGKIKDEVYALDFAYPLCAQSAFAIALASIDSKLCYAV